MRGKKSADSRKRGEKEIINRASLSLSVSIPLKRGEKGKKARELRPQLRGKRLAKLGKLIWRGSMLKAGKKGSHGKKKEGRGIIASFRMTRLRGSKGQQGEHHHEGIAWRRTRAT